MLWKDFKALHDNACFGVYKYKQKQRGGYIEHTEKMNYAELRDDELESVAGGFSEGETYI